MARKEGLIGRKVGMTQVFADNGNQVPVTVIEAGPCTVVGVRTKDSHGYDALQLGFEAGRKKMPKPQAGVFRKDPVGRKGLELRVSERKMEVEEFARVAKNLLARQVVPQHDVAQHHRAARAQDPRALGEQRILARHQVR